MEAAGTDSNSDLSSTNSSFISDWTHNVSRRYQHLLDKSTPHVLRRWIGFGLIALIYMIRVYFLEGFYIVSYGLGIYILNLLIAFLSPQVDPEAEALVGDDGPSLPTRGSDEFRPFVRRLPEFKFWYSMTKAFCIAFLMTYNSAFDVPVFWPILLFYWMVLFFLTMKRQILHMIKYKYVPFSLGKQRYTGKRAASSDDASS
ncbi:Protein rer1a [Ranunculus cassubicifolius]